MKKFRWSYSVAARQTYYSYKECGYSDEFIIDIVNKFYGDPLIRQRIMKKIYKKRLTKNLK